MEEKVKQISKSFFRRKVKKILLLALIPIIIVLILAGTSYLTTKDDAEYREGDMSSTPYAASTYINNVKVEEDGTLKSDKTAQELWDEMIKNGSRVNQYLSNPRELAILMKAEIVTQYPDTRKDPDKEIDWKEIKKNEDQLQGIVKFKRASDGQTAENATTMTYVDPATFQSYIDDYNETGSEEAKKNALKHFTLRKTSTTNVTTSGGIGSFERYTDLTEEQLKAIATVALQEQGEGNLKGNAAEISLMANLYEREKNNGYTSVYDYVKRSGWFKNASSYMDSFVTSNGNGSIDSNPEVLELTKIILVQGKRTLPGYVDEHDHISDIAYVTNDGISIDKNDKTQYIQFKSIIHQGGSVGEGQWTYYCHPSESSDAFGYTSEERRAQIGELYYEFDELFQNTGSTSNDNKDSNNNSQSGSSKKEYGEKTTGTTIENDGYEKEYTSSAGITYKCYKQGGCNKYSSIPYSTGNIGTSGCGPSSVAILASGLVDSNITPEDTAVAMYERNNGGPTNYERLKVEMESRGMTSEVIWGPSAEDIQTNLKNGKVMLVSVNGNTIFTSASHIMAIVDINTDGQVYICNPSKSTNDGWFDISEIMKGCDYIVVTDAGASGIAVSRSTGTGYAAVVATWTQIDTSLESNDPNVETYSETQYRMTTTTVNYQAMVQKYTMPFDFLWALTVVGEEKEFAFELADLVFGSDIQVTIYDNLTINTNVDDWNYDRQDKTQVDIYISAYAAGAGASRRHNNHEHVDTYPYNTKKTVITQTNTINAILTRANTWIVDYTNNYEYSEPTSSTSQSTVTQEDQSYPSSPNSTGNSHSCGLTEQYKADVTAEVLSKTTTSNSNTAGPTAQPQVSIVEQYAVRYYSRYINISDAITNTTETRKYIEGTPTVREKTSKEEDEFGQPLELNFVTIFRKAEHIEARKNILSVAEWLFEIIEENGKTDVDLVRYLLYMATGNNYGITEYDFSEYDASKFSDISGIYGGTIQEKVWFALKDLGYSDMAAAGAMGNLDYESGGFNASTIEEETGEGIGICQWSFGRKSQLIAYAKSKGKEWSDEDTQVEFLITELTGDGPAKGFATYQLQSNKGYSPSDFKNAKSVEEATKAFCWTFERPNESDGNASMSERIKRAQKYYKECPNWSRVSGSGEILTVCEEVMNDMIKRNVHYSTSNLIWRDIKSSSQHSYACCASYVSIVLYKSGLLTESQINAYNYNYTGSGGVPDMLKAAGWHQVEHSEIQTGDVINDYGNHVLIYAGGNKVYDQNCGVVSSSGRAPIGGPYDGWSRYSGNSNVQVWRAPNK